MPSIKIIETRSDQNGVYVAWQIIKDGQAVGTRRLNFNPELSKDDIMQALANYSEEYLAKLENPPQPPSLDGELDQELAIDDLKPVRTLESAKLSKTDQINEQVQRFLERKSDGNPRYELQHQIATLASLTASVEKLNAGGLTTGEEEELKAKINRTAQMWAWMEQAFYLQGQARAQVEAMQTIEEVDAFELDLTSMELSDPDVYLAEIWDRLPVVEE
jgi:hypothetical protein